MSKAERSAPEILRAIADAVEDKRQMENVETCRRVPSHDQNLLLALNRIRKREKEFVLPDAGVVTEWLKKILITVSTTDGQSAALGIFYTNRSPTNRKMWQVAIGIFPLYADVADYYIRPDVNSGIWQSRGIIHIEDSSAPGEDPFMVYKPGGLDFIFFKKNPFTKKEPYQTVLPDQSISYPGHPELHEKALEANVIKRALWFAIVQSRKPGIFLEPGFSEFIRANRSDPKYAELYRTWRFKFRNTGSDWTF